MTDVTISAPITRLRRSGSYRGALWLVEIMCPLCGRPHTHTAGASPMTPILGYRMARCNPNDKRNDKDEGYVITDPNGITYSHGVNATDSEHP
jgi:hypothetical protein